jgi:hypothetical protein
MAEADLERDNVEALLVQTLLKASAAYQQTPLIQHTTRVNQTVGELPRHSKVRRRFTILTFLRLSIDRFLDTILNFY